jgi:hypothetical protein
LKGTYGKCPIYGKREKEEKGRERDLVSKWKIRRIIPPVHPMFPREDVYHPNTGLSAQVGPVDYTNANTHFKNYSLKLWHMVIFKSVRVISSLLYYKSNYLNTNGSSKF